MKKKILFLVFVASVASSSYSVYRTSLLEKNLFDVTLNDVESLATNEGDGMHGRPLLQNIETGAYKCGNCIGDDCGAIC